MDKKTGGSRFDKSAVPSMSISFATTRRWNETSIAVISKLTWFNSKTCDRFVFVEKGGGFEHLNVDIP